MCSLSPFLSGRNLCPVICVLVRVYSVHRCVCGMSFVLSTKHPASAWSKWKAEESERSPLSPREDGTGKGGQLQAAPAQLAITFDLPFGIFIDLTK